MVKSKREMGVRQVRGPFVRLAPHPQACLDEDEFRAWVGAWRRDHPEALLAADLFSGAGGLSLGLHQAGIQVVLAVDHDVEAVETHRHHFPGLSVDWDLGDPEVVERVGSMLRDCQIDVLAGGPPCQPFSKAGRSKIRDRVRRGLRDPHDQRRDLWRSFLEVARLAEPAAVVMENVPDMVLDREMFILRSAVLELEGLGYSVDERVVQTRNFGVPQYRQRMILVGAKRPRRFRWPEETPEKVSVGLALSDLPKVQGGWRPEGGAEGWQTYSGPRNAYQRLMREAVPVEHEGRVYDHITRPVRPDDEAAFALMEPGTKYSDLPDEYKRYRDDIFDDKYKRLAANEPSRTITAHIAKDGYWYIHPYENRTITIREAARLQTFPDGYRFAGPPSAAFRQIGNAVPPRLGQVIGEGLQSAFVGIHESDYFSSEDSARSLADWFAARPDLRLPWLRATTRWQALLGECLLERTSPENVRSIWPLLQRWVHPEQTLAAATELRMIAEWIQRPARAGQILAVAQLLKARGLTDIDDDTFRELVETKLIPPAYADIASLIAPPNAVSTARSETADAAEEPVIINKGVLRVAANFTGEQVNARNRLTDGRIAVARLIGYGERARSAHLALMELSNTYCRPSQPECGQCPLQARCSYAARERARSVDRLVDLTEDGAPLNDHSVS